MKAFKECSNLATKMMFHNHERRMINPRINFLPLEKRKRKILLAPNLNTFYDNLSFAQLFNQQLLFLNRILFIHCNRLVRKNLFPTGSLGQKYKSRVKKQKGVAINYLY